MPGDRLLLVGAHGDLFIKRSAGKGEDEMIQEVFRRQKPYFFFSEQLYSDEIHIPYNPPIKHTIQWLLVYTGKI